MQHTQTTSLTLLAAAALLTGACTTTPPARCDAGALDATIARVEAADEGRRPALILAGVGAACDDGDLGVLFNTPGANHASMVTDYARAHPDIWTKGCPAGMKPLATFHDKDKRTRLAGIHQVCELDRFGWSLPRARIMGDRVPIGILVAGRLQDTDATRRQRLLDLLAGK